MKNIYICISLFFCMVSCVFGKLYNGMGMELAKKGTGMYYKQLWALSNHSQIITDTGLLFDQSNYSNDIYGKNNFQNTIVDITLGYRYEHFFEQLAGTFRPISMVGAGGTSELVSFSKKNIIGIWTIKYFAGLGIQFYNDKILNEICIKYAYTKNDAGHIRFQLAFYWK